MKYLFCFIFSSINLLSCFQSHKPIRLVLWSGFDKDKLTIYNQNKLRILDTVLTTQGSISYAGGVFLNRHNLQTLLIYKNDIFKGMIPVPSKTAVINCGFMQDSLYFDYEDNSERRIL